VDPAEELPWLRDMIDDYETTPVETTQYIYIVQGTYKKQTVFIHMNCCPYCDSVTPVLNCQGELLFYYSDARSAEIAHKKVIWKPSDCACQL
jgi:hypothetical protein